MTKEEANQLRKGSIVYNINFGYLLLLEEPRIKEETEHYECSVYSIDNKPHRMIQIIWRFDRNRVISF